MDQCYLSKVHKCQCPNSPDLRSNGPARLQTMVNCSKMYNDNLHEELEKCIQMDSEFTVKTHRTCISSYTSPKTIAGHLKRKGHEVSSKDIGASPAKQRRRSGMPHFDFQHHCIFCGDVCEIVKDKKHPERWRKAYLCRTLGTLVDFKDEIIQKCEMRGDKWASEVKVRVHGAISDLHAADARYHVDCKAKFMTPKHIRLAATKSSTASSSKDTFTDTAFETLCGCMLEDQTRVWNSVELFETYTSEGGEQLNRRRLVDMLTEKFGDDLLVLTATGVASIIVFKAKAPALLKVVSDKDEPISDSELKKLTKQIVKECNGIELNKKNYQTRVNKQTIEMSLSETLMKLLSQLSKKLQDTPTSYLIGSIITSTLTHFPTPLQIALGVLMRNSKALVKQMSSFGVTCTYDEVLRFKKSAAVAATSSASLQGISDCSHGLVQVVVDNFDADISSQNGKISTHSLAMLVTQPDTPEDDDHSDDEVIRRVEKTEMTNPIDFDVNIEHYTGPKNADMPVKAALRGVPPLKLLAEVALSSRRAQDIDVTFFNDVLASEGCPEFNGYNTKRSREQGHARRQKTKAVYLPLIDRTPSDPDTIKTALKQAQLIAERCGQEYTVFTGDLQLYRVALNIIWANPDQHSNVVLRLGGMHTLMSFVGSVGTLMEGSGLVELLESTFGGVLKMLSGKKFPQNVRALRMLSEELLRETFTVRRIVCMSDLEKILAELSSRSRTSKLWIDCVIKPVFIMMMFIRAERENDWCLHLTAVSCMIPYFFAAGHVNYARYGLYYLRSMESMPTSCQAKFLKGEHVMRHIPGVWNGIWSDMYIETTFMRYGHGKQGIIGITMKPDILKIWSLGLHICTMLERDILSLVSEDEGVCEEKHKEEMKARIASDKADRLSLQKALKDCIDPINPASHPAEIVNIVTGQIAPDTVNVDRAIEIGVGQMEDFERGWPTSFQNKISRKVKTQAESRKSIKIGDTKVFDTELIFTRVIGLQASSRDFDVKKLLTYELAPVPTSMFSDSGEMRIAKSKSVLKNMLQIEVSARSTAKRIDSVIIDGSAVLYVIRWPSSGTVGDFVFKFRHYIENKLADNDVYLVFDRYREYSIKSMTREHRGYQNQRVHNLSIATQIPPQKAILSVPENKAQLIALIVSDLCNNVSFQNNVPQTRKLIVTGEDETPTEVTPTVTIQRRDLRNTHEEADNIIAHQMVAVAKENDGGILVLSDDTDVFVLLLHHFLDQGISNTVVMQSPVQGRSALDITTTANRNKEIVPDLLAAHALSGSDTTACYYGIGKGTALKVLRTGAVSLSCIGEEASDLSVVKQTSTRFISQCYNVTADDGDMSQIRQKVWSSKVGKASSCAPKLASLPPTTDAFIENVKRAHFQTCVWKHAVDPDPPDLDPLDFGWEKNENTRTLVPIMLPPNIPVAPDEVLKMIKCSCETQTPCSTLRCHCNSSRLSCTMFCKCQGSELCNNEQTKRADLEDKL